MRQDSARKEEPQDEPAAHSPAPPQSAALLLIELKTATKTAKEPAMERAEECSLEPRETLAPRQPAQPAAPLQASRPEAQSQAGESQPEAQPPQAAALQHASPEIA